MPVASKHQPLALELCCYDETFIYLTNVLFLKARKENSAVKDRSHKAEASKSVVVQLAITGLI